MPHFNDHELFQWIEGNSPDSTSILAGSLGPGLTLNELVKLSNDPETTAKVFNFGDISIAPTPGFAGGVPLREQVARLYDQSKVKVTADDVVIANAATGANLLLFQSLLSPGDHVVSQYPTYGPLLEIPQMLGAKLSYWKSDPNNAWASNLSDLEALIRPKTKLIILNNPHNPTGSVLTTTAQRDILDLAKKYSIPVHCDEIFRPMFHSLDGEGQIPTSIIEHESYDRTIATGSLSKAWCFSGVRIGWCVTRNAEIRDKLLSLRQWTVESVSAIDEIIGAEVLSERCRDNIHKRLAGFAKENLSTLKEFVLKNPKTVACAIPPGGSTTFVKFMDPKTGEAVDDVLFCKTLKQEKGLLLSPGGLSF